MACRTRSYSRRRRPRKNFRKAVKNVVHSLAESKTVRREIKGDMNLSSFQGEAGFTNYFYKALLVNAGIAEGAAVNQRTGKDIYMKGVRLELFLDNTSLGATVPVYMTMLVLSSQLVGPPNVKLFKGYDVNNAFDLPTTANEEFKREMHVSAINTSRYRVLHRSALRLGCKGEPDLPGPRLSQRVIYVPLNKKAKLDDVAGTDLNIKPNIWVVLLGSNPTQLSQTGTSVMKFEVNSTLYYKDF